jgi:hypothetical protein
MAIIVNAALSFPPTEVLDALAVIVLATTVVSGFSYVTDFTRRAWEQDVRTS